MKKILLIIIFIFNLLSAQAKDFADVKGEYSYFAPYMKQLQKDIKKNWEPPKYSKTIKLVTFFTIDKNGELLDLKLIRPSDNEKLNQSTLKAIEKTAPFAPLPEEYEKNTISIEFSFDYNVHCLNLKCKHR
jgi:TonB family protein